MRPPVAFYNVGVSQHLDNGVQRDRFFKCLQLYFLRQLFILHASQQSVAEALLLVSKVTFVGLREKDSNVGTARLIPILLGFAVRKFVFLL